MNPILTILQSELLDYEKIPMPSRFEAQTDRAVLLRGHWLPLSQLRRDRAGTTLYVKTWLYERMTETETER